MLTFLLGVLTAVLGYVLSNFVFRPLQKYYGVRGKIGYKLTYYSHIVTSPGGNKDLEKEAYSVIRDLACDLERRYLAVPFRQVFVVLGVIPPNEVISRAKGQLILLANSLDDNGKVDENHKALAKVFTLLGIKELDDGHIVKSASFYPEQSEVE